MLAAPTLSTPLSTLDPAGPAGASIAGVWWTMLAAALLILVLTVALALYAACRNPARRARLSPRLLIVGGGLLFPLATLAALLTYGIGAGHALLPLPGAPDVYRVEVRAHQWWWEVSYPDAPGGRLYSANEIHVPVGRPIDVHVSAEDVIHSFWVPRLGGKIDAIPGRTTVIRLQADRAGVYHGVCAEFCGAQHARMGLQLEAHEAPSLQRRMDRLAAAVGSAGQPSFDRLCAQCHSLDARRRGNGKGPNLAALADRAMLGAGVLRNDEAGLRRWLAEHAALKPGNRMQVPDGAASPDPLDAATLDALAGLLAGSRP
ncbi:MAG: cytochrome C oxidase subunit II [Burkholderiaceae bacterium]